LAGLPRLARGAVDDRRLRAYGRRRDHGHLSESSLRNLTPACGSVLAVGQPYIIGELDSRAGVVQWQYRSFPSFGRGFDSHRPLQKSAKLRLIRLYLLTRIPHLTRPLRPATARS